MVDMVWLATATMKDVIYQALAQSRAALSAQLVSTGAMHRAYARMTNSPAAAKIAGECAQRCETFATELATYQDFKLDDLAGRVELFTLACKVLSIPAAYRQRIAEREATAVETRIAAPPSALTRELPPAAKPWTEVDDDPVL